MSTPEEKIMEQNINETIKDLETVLNVGVSGERDWYNIGKLFGKLEAAKMLGMLKPEDVAMFDALEGILTQAFEIYS